MAFNKSRKQYKSNSRSKTRRGIFSKMYGGTHEDSHYVLAGFITQTFVGINIHGHNHTLNDMGKLPIFLRKEKNPRNMIPDPYFRNGVSGHDAKHYFLHMLYKLNYRGLNFNDEFRSGHYFLDEEDIPIIDNAALTYALQSTGPLENLITYNEHRKNAVRQMELKYPALFQRMFVSEEEERDAISRIENETKTPRIKIRKINPTNKTRFATSIKPRIIHK